MPSDSELAALLQAATGSRPAPINAQTYIRKWPTSSKPVAVLCDDGCTYVVKARQPNPQVPIGRVMITEQIVARAGLLIEAPVATVALVQVSAALISAQPEMQHMEPGLAHGSKFMVEVTEQMALDGTHPENRDRFARLAVLFGWMNAADHQFVYNKTGPRLVYSVDHGHFFVGGPDWTLVSLGQTAVAQLDPTVTNACALTQAEKENAVRHLDNVKDPSLAQIVAVPPDEWGFTEAERVALLKYLIKRRDEILAAFPV